MPHFSLAITGFPVRPFKYGLGLMGIAWGEGRGEGSVERQRKGGVKEKDSLFSTYVTVYQLQLNLQP